MQNACQSIIDQLPSQGSGSSSNQIPAKELAEYRRWAQCMRQHGLFDWPDPNPDGSFTLPAGLSAASARSGLYAKEIDACKKYVPADG